MADDLSHGWTIVFGTSGFSANITDIDPPGYSRGSVGTSHQGTVGYKTFSPEDLVDGGELTFSGNWDAADDPPMTAAAETITMTAPDGSTLVFSAFVTDYQPSAPHLGMMTFSMTLKVTGSVTHDPLGSGTGSTAFTG